MSIFDLYSAQEIDTFLGKMGTLQRTSNTTYPENRDHSFSPNKLVDEDSVIQDILAMGTQLLKEKEESLGEIEGLQSREENSFTIPESFEEIPESPKNKSQKTRYQTDQKLQESNIKHQTLHHQSLNKSIQKSSKLLDKLRDQEPAKPARVNRGVELSNKLFEDMEVRKERLKQECIKQRVKNEYKIMKESQTTTQQIKVPFKKALERRGQELTIGHRLYNNAEAIRAKKNEALLFKVEKEREQLSKIPFQPDLSRSQSNKTIVVSQSFTQRLQHSKEKIISNRAEVMIDELKKSPFKPRLLTKKDGVSKISGIWKSSQNLSVSRKESHDHLVKSFFSQYNKSFVKPVEKSSYIEIKNPQELDFLLQ